ncbi:hypothetical protein [Belnapia moabensis]|nr:hypothetical protein [Belnapia moabensis]
MSDLRSRSERNHYLIGPPPRTALNASVDAIKARWERGRAHQ